MKTRRDEEKQDEEFLTYSSAKTRSNTASTARQPPTNSLFYTGPIDRDDILKDRRITRSMTVQDSDLTNDSDSEGSDDNHLFEEEKEPEMKHSRHQRQGSTIQKGSIRTRRRKQYIAPVELSTDDEENEVSSDDEMKTNQQTRPSRALNHNHKAQLMEKYDGFYYVNEKDPYRSTVQSPFSRTQTASKSFSFVPPRIMPVQSSRSSRIRIRSRSTVRPSADVDFESDVKSSFQSHCNTVLNYSSLLSNCQFDPSKNVGSIQPQIYGDIVIDDNHQILKRASHFDLMNIVLWVCASLSMISIGYTGLVYLGQLRSQYYNSSWKDFLYNVFVDGLFRYPRKTAFNEYASVSLWLCMAFYMLHVIVTSYRLHRLEYMKWITSASFSSYFQDHSSHHHSHLEHDNLDEDANFKYKRTRTGKRRLSQPKLSYHASGELPCNVPSSGVQYELEYEQQQHGFPMYIQSRYFAFAIIACFLPAIIGISVSIFLMTIYLRFQGDSDKQSVCYTASSSHQENDNLKSYANIQHALTACSYAFLFALGVASSAIQFKPLTANSLHHNVIVNGFNSTINGAYTLDLLWCSLALAFRLMIHLRTKNRLQSLAKMNVVVGSIVQSALILLTAVCIFSTSGIIIPCIYFMTNEVVRLLKGTPEKSPVEQHIYYQTALHSDI